MPNRLADEKSPYLLQHAHNPVDWWPWSDAAFAEAERRGVSVFLSIGYATCHWCHVMEEESFEDTEAARALNRAFVCVKVDREERPDVDGIYMAAALALHGSGGWPLTALLVPETRQPFYVATYLPKRSRGRRIGVMELCERVTDLWQEKRAEVRESAEQVAGAIGDVLSAAEPGEAITEADLTRAVGQFERRFDPSNGGFGSQPKFPTPHNLLFLLRQTRRTGEPRPAEMAVRTLRAIARGGITDHAGGGVHRYSTDRRWLLPHFEKMLYDQAGLAMAWTEAWHLTGDPEMREAAEHTLDYVVRDLQQDHGGLASAEDADSLDAHGRREEGAFYVWTEAEIAEIIGEEALPFVRAALGTTPEGNYRDEATRQRTGASVLHLPDDPARLGDALGRTEAEVLARRREILDRLFRARNVRPRPLLDDKILTDWNGLAIAALATAARVFSREDYAAAAHRAAEFVLTHLHRPDGSLLHRWRDGEAAVPGFLDDYAFLALGLTDLYAATDEARYLGLAMDLHRQTRERFEAPEGGYYLSEPDPGLIVRQRALDDGALPSGHAIACLNGLRLGVLAGEPEWEASTRRALASDARLRAHPSGHTAHLLAAQIALGPAVEIVIAPGEGEDTLREALREVYAPGAVFLRATPEVAALVPFTASQTARDGLATAYICENGACQAPTTDPTEAPRTLAETVSGTRP
ncbi:MAG: thioredoxin domain-containing protein [Bacteroidota bacterium]